MSTQEQNTPTLDELAEQYVNIAFIDYGDLNEQSEQDIRNAYTTGYRKATLAAISAIDKLPFSMANVIIKERLLKSLESKHP